MISGYMNKIWLDFDLILFVQQRHDWTEIVFITVKYCNQKWAIPLFIFAHCYIPPATVWWLEIIIKNSLEMWNRFIFGNTCGMAITSGSICILSASVVNTLSIFSIKSMFRNKNTWFHFFQRSCVVVTQLIIVVWGKKKICINSFICSWCPHYNMYLFNTHTFTHSTY